MLRKRGAVLQSSCSAKFGSWPFDSNRLPAIPVGPQEMPKLYVLNEIGRCKRVAYRL